MLTNLGDREGGCLQKHLGGWYAGQQQQKVGGTKREPSVVEKPPGSRFYGAVWAGALNGGVGVSDTHPKDVFVGALGVWFRHGRRYREL